MTGLVLAAGASLTFVGSGQLDGQWQLTSLAIDDVAEPPAGMLNVDGNRVWGRAPACNDFSAHVDLDSSKFVVDELFTSLTSCYEDNGQVAGTALGPQLEALLRVNSWEISDGILTLEGDNVVLAYRHLGPLPVGY